MVNSTSSSMPFLQAVFAETTPYSMLARVGMAAMFYAIVILKAVVPATRKKLQAYPTRWNKMHSRAGAALTSTAEETVLAFALSIHHITGGLLMLAGQLLRSPDLWVSGLCIEIGFEIIDIMALLANAWPYPLVQPGLKFITIAHHIPGISRTFIQTTKL